MHPEGGGLINRRALLLIVAVAAIGAAVAGGMFPGRQRAPSSSQSRMSNEMGLSHFRGGHLYMQTNETRNGSLEEVTSVTIPYNSPEGLAGF